MTYQNAVGANNNQGAAPQQAQQPQQFSMDAVLDFYRAPVERSEMSDHIKKFVDALNKINETGPKGVKVQCITIDPATDPKVQIPLLMIDVATQGEGTVGVHVLMLEDKTSRGHVSNFVSNGQTQPVVKYAGDLFSEAVQKYLNGILLRRGGKINNIATSGVTVVPFEFAYNDEAAVREVMVAAIQAASAARFSSNSNRPVLSVAQIAKNETLVARPTFGNQDQVTVTGMPIRSDVIIEIGVERKAELAIDNTNKFTPIGAVHGYFDLIYVNPQQSQPVMMAGYVQAPSTKQYRPEFVITAVNCTTPALSQQLLVIATAIDCLAKDNTWRYAFQLQTEVAGQKLHDLAGLAYELLPTANKPFDTSDPTTMAQVIGSYFHDSFVVSMDIGIGTGESWNVLHFLSANAGSNSAGLMTNEANLMTDGKFEAVARQMNASMGVTYGEPIKVHNGYFTTAGGERYDSRHVDYTAVMNTIGGKQPTAIQQWSDSILAANTNPLQQMAIRRKIIEDVKPSQIYGTSQRVVLDTMFFSALSQAFAGCGLRVQNQSNNTGNLWNARATYSGHAGFSQSYFVGAQGVGAVAGYNGGQIYVPNNVYRY